MKLFLSWSGPQSRVAAEKFCDWIPLIINAVEPWMSAKDIDAGARWSPEIQKELEESSFGIVFVTKSNMDAPWLLFEAGALAKTLEDTFLCPYLLGVKTTDLDGPLVQFQAKVTDRSGTLQLVTTINDQCGDRRISEKQLLTSFERWWPDLEQQLKDIPDDPGAKSPARKDDELIAEVLTTVRRLDRNVTELQNDRPIRASTVYTGRATHDIDRTLQNDSRLSHAVRSIIVDGNRFAEISQNQPKEIETISADLMRLTSNRVRMLVDQGLSNDEITRNINGPKGEFFSRNWIGSVIHDYMISKNKHEYGGFDPDTAAEDDPE